MATHERIGTIDTRFSSEHASPTPWPDAEKELKSAGVYWLATVRPDGRPHVTPLMGVWLDGIFSFCTGERERKAKNLAENRHVVVTTGCNSMTEGLDVVIEGDAVRLTDAARLQQLAERYTAKYDWTVTVRDGGFAMDPDEPIALVFDVTPVTIFAFKKGEPFSQTRWMF
jgi:nitroimidazol reductase NimA-like FMN-containing flavoprotein (pyridoxamine 5'-phosphate oxidase superfamily)